MSSNQVENNENINDDFPAGILESVRGKYTDYVLFNWDKNAVVEIISFIQRLAQLVTTRAEQLNGNNPSSNLLPLGTVLTAGLSEEAFRGLNIKVGGFSFDDLADTFFETTYDNAFSPNLEEALRDPKMILVVNHNDNGQLMVAVDCLRAMVADAGILGGNDLIVMRGETLRKKFYDGQDEAVVNSFGYAEGRSGRLSPTEKWKATRIDFNAAGQKQFGSLMCFIRFVFDTTKFEEYVKEIAVRLYGNNSPGIDEINYVKGALMGRFPDGSPLALTNQPSQSFSTNNTFDFFNDVDGVKCPLSAHIRVANDRSETTANKIVRRGVSFLQSHDAAQSEGLFFVSYQASVKQQLLPIYDRIGKLEDAILYRNNKYAPFINKQWRAHPIYHPTKSGVAVKLSDPKNDFITYTGEEYFYVPPRSFLSSLPIMEDDAS